MKFFVLGGTGKMGRIAVLDLLRSKPKNEVFIGGRNKEEIEWILKKYSPRARFVFVDLNDIRVTARSIKESGAKIILNAAQYYYNVQAMKACLLAGTDYLDLGGLFWVTKEQTKLHSKFRKKGLLAVLGCGSTPGINNVLAAKGMLKLDKVNKIILGFGWAELKAGKKGKEKFFSPYSIYSILDEFTKKPVILKNGSFVQIEPFSDEASWKFVTPIGSLSTACTIHSEVFNFWRSYKNRGLKTVCFRAGFPKEFFDKMKFLVDLGFASEKPIDIKDCKLSPRDFLAKFVNRLPKPKERLNEIEDLKVELYGYKGKRKLKIYEDCITKSQKKWFEFGSDIDTGMPLSIIAQIIAKGLIKEKGVYSPEQVFVDKKLQNIFFRELKKRGMKFREKIQSGWN